MDSRKKQEEKNKRVGWLVSISTQIFLLLLFYFLIAWKAPFPPIPEYGIELGFSQSAGAAPTPTPINNESDSEPESQPEVTSDSENETVEESAEQPVQQEAVVEESPTPVEKIEESSEQEAIETPQEQEEPIEETEDSSDNPQESSEEPVEQTIDDRAIYGNQGTSTGSEDGASLALSGWIWDFEPKPEDTSDETGKIVYEIEVDQDGYLVKITPTTSTVSPAIERKYRQAVQQLTFSKTSEYKPAARSKGTLTFIIKTK